MKAVILSVENNDIKNQNIYSPFALTIGNISLIEYQIRLLKLLGLKNEDITIISNDYNCPESENLNTIFIKNKIKNINVKNSDKRSFSSLKLFVENLENEDDLLIINGDSYFELKDLEKLILEKSNSKILTENRNSLHSAGLEIKSIGLKIKEISSGINHTSVPWSCYYGAMYLNKNDLIILRNFIEDLEEDRNFSYLEVLVNELGIYFEKIDINKSVNGVNSIEDKTMELVGGSFAGLHKITLVKKYSEKEGNEKLVSEINWLNNLPNNIKNKFIPVIDYRVGENESYFTMPWYDLENLRKKIISGKFSIKETMFYIEKVLDYMFDNLYSKKITVADENWIYDKHFDRVFSRFEKIKDIEPFSRILNKKKVFINGKEYLNLPILINKLLNFEKKSNFFAPKDLVMVHGDLHFQNILVDTDKDDFILADPRGEEFGSDIYYDFGKLWHSINGLYDLIHTDISQAKIIDESKDNVSFDLYLAGSELLDTYSKLKIEVENLITKYPIVKDKYWDLKTKFAEAMHFSSLMYFHLKYDKVENRALCLYLQGIILTTELLNELEKVVDEN